MGGSKEDEGIKVGELGGGVVIPCDRGFRLCG